MRRLATIIIGLSVIFYLLFINTSGKTLRPKIIQELPRITQKIQDFPRFEPSPKPEPLTAQSFLAAINSARGRSKITLLQQNSLLCPLAQDLLEGQLMQNSTIEKECPLCTNVLSLVFDSRISSDSAITQIQESSVSAVLTSGDFRQACTAGDGDQVAIVAAKIKKPTPTPAPQRLISEDELWQALGTYREAHKVSRLEKDEKLCQYARKRVEDHLTLLASHIPKDQYPVPAKYPLDAHEGFKKDAESEYVFDVVGRQVVAENLAYWPNAEYGIHVIEWGWDSSTEGHRETQLSNEFSVGCLTGKQGFFVAIFGR